jgi:hypothetical protein
MKSLSLAMISASILVVSVDAWGAVFEPIKGGFSGRTALRATNENEEEHESASRHRHSSGDLSRISYTLHYESRYVDVNGELLRSRLFIAEPLVLDAAMFGIKNPYDSVDGDLLDEDYLSCGEDCMECPIPEEYKEIAAENKIDVMAFLGLRRAEPIRVDRHLQGEWE